MELSKHDVVNFGEIQSLSNLALIAINEKLCIEHINAYSKKLLGIRDNDNVMSKSIIEVFEQLHLPPLINNKGKIIPTGFILINHCFQKWEKTAVNVESDTWWLLIGHKVVQQKKYIRFYFKRLKNDIGADIWKEKRFI